LRKGEFSAVFNAQNTGIISFIFKFLNKNNYYVFEIGGSKKDDQRFFRLRKKVNGIMKVLGDIEEKEELLMSGNLQSKKDLVFGYDINVFYRVRIVTTKKHFSVFISKKGKGEFLVFDIKDTDIPYGRVGVGTFYTTAVFDMISIKPSVESKRLYVSDEEVREINKDEVFAYKKSSSASSSKSEPIVSSQSESIKKPPTKAEIARQKEEGIANVKKHLAWLTENKVYETKKNKISWMKCIRNVGTEERKSFCKDEFKGLMNVQRKCEKRFL